jgi:hypothetical protein
MRKLFTFLLLLTLTLFSRAQSQSDHESVLKLCFTNAEMIESNHLNDKGIPVLVIVDSGVLSSSLTIKWFDNPIEFKTAQEITESNIQAFIAFDSLTLNDSQAVAGFSYNNQRENNVKHFILQFSKDGNNWINRSN